jgi:hypothetical protein
MTVVLWVLGISIGAALGVGMALLATLVGVLLDWWLGGTDGLGQCVMCEAEARHRRKPRRELPAARLVRR